jgi:NAD+ synthase (glutamine-hydrolysing)
MSVMCCLATQVMHSAYLGTVNSSQDTEDRAASLAKQIGFYHQAVKIDPMVEAVTSVFAQTFGGKTPKFESAGGSKAEDIALQNIQARLRMVESYLLAQMLPWVRERRGFLLVLGSANVDEALRGYMTKYDSRTCGRPQPNRGRFESRPQGVSEVGRGDIQLGHAAGG